MADYSVEPNSTIRLIKNVPLDNTYEHTIYWSGNSPSAKRENQYNYFTDPIKFPFWRVYNNQSYQRHTKNTIRLRVDTISDPWENIMDYNYLMFKNTSFENKWFYAFILNIEYINNYTYELTYEIDYMQTWLEGADYSLNKCFVEREHADTDVAGDNTVPENLEHGEYYMIQATEKSIFPHGLSEGQWCIGVFSTVDDNNAFVTGQLASGVYNGAYCFIFNSVGDVNNYLMSLTDDNKQNAVVNIVMLPRFVGDQASLYAPAQISIDDITRLSSFGNYTPRNQKLYTAPYMKLFVNAGNGNSAEYPYEFFRDPTTPTFILSGSRNGIPELALQPIAYKGSGANTPNNNEILISADLPQCSWIVDSYRAWVAQGGLQKVENALALNTISTGANIGKGIAGVLGNALSGNVGGAVNSIGNTAGNLISNASVIADAMNEKIAHETLPPQAKGSASNGISIGLDFGGFQIYHARIRSGWAKRIDNYFSLYGYATHEIKVPNTHSRKRWCYTKTVNCNLLSQYGLPTIAEERIKAIYNNGITFWNYRSDMQVAVYDFDDNAII